MTQLLASVTNKAEAMLAMSAGADIIDLKNPAAGALGALPLAVIEEIVAAVDGLKPVSATIGDLPMQPALLLDAVRKTAVADVDFIKIGFFEDNNVAACLEALGSLATDGISLVAVLFADGAPDFGLVPQLAHAGIHGVMLDTAIKNGKRLRDRSSASACRTLVCAPVSHARRDSVQPIECAECGGAGADRVQACVYVEAAVGSRPDSRTSGVDGVATYTA